MRECSPRRRVVPVILSGPCMSEPHDESKRSPLPRHLHRWRRDRGPRHRPDRAAAPVRDDPPGDRSRRGARDPRHGGAGGAADRGDGCLWRRARHAGGSFGRGARPGHRPTRRHPPHGRQPPLGARRGAYAAARPPARRANGRGLRLRRPAMRRRCAHQPRHRRIRAWNLPGNRRAGVGRCRRRPPTQRHDALQRGLAGHGRWGTATAPVYLARPGLPFTCGSVEPGRGFQGAGLPRGNSASTGSRTPWCRTARPGTCSAAARSTW